jgi:hypothetical protein
MSYFRTKLTAEMTSKLTNTLALVAVFIVTAASFSTVQAQNVDRLLVLCEGGFYLDTGEAIEWPTLGVFNESEASYEVAITYVGHHFASDMLVDGVDLYVAAEDTIYRYDVNTFELLASQAVDGARKLAMWEDALIVSRGDFDPLTWAPVSFDSYLQWFDRSDLSWMGEAPTSNGPAFSGAGVVIKNNKAHMIINNGFAWGQEVGLIGHIDLATGAYSETELGENGVNPVHLFDAGSGLLAVNTMQYASTSLSRLSGGVVTTELVADVAAGCGAAALWEGAVVFQITGETTMRIHGADDLAPAGVWGTGQTSFYGMAAYPEADRVFAGSTDFVSSGSVSVYNMAGELQTNFSTGLAPGHFARVAGLDGVSETPEAAPRVELGRYDLLGRSISKGANATGFSVVRYNDGTAQVQHHVN